MLHDVTTGFISKLRHHDQEAWTELHETFEPILQALLRKWGRGQISWETVEDVSQNTMMALLGAIDRHDPSRGARFSSWLLAIAKYTLGGEFDRKMAQKRGGGQRPATLEEAWAGEDEGAPPDREFEQGVFDAKVMRALRLASEECEGDDGLVYSMRVFDGKQGKEVAVALGVSEPTISRRLFGFRDLLKRRLEEVMLRFSFTQEELEEAPRNGLDWKPTKADDQLFDDAVAEIYHRSNARAARWAASPA